MHPENSSIANSEPSQAGQRGSLSVIAGFCWIDSQRTQGFATWADEIAHMETLGYQLVPPDYHIPHWSQAEDGRKLYVSGRDGPREMTACFDRPARDLGYPLFFKQNH
jgi:hypothetical protein